MGEFVFNHGVGKGFVTGSKSRFDKRKKKPDEFYYIKNFARPKLNLTIKVKYRYHIPPAVLYQAGYNTIFGILAKNASSGPNHEEI